MTIERTMGTVARAGRLTLRGGDGRLVDWCMVAELDAMRVERDAAKTEVEAHKLALEMANVIAGDAADDLERLLAERAAAIARAERQAVELRAAQEQAERRNRELDALHYVWCDGGCDSGVHRWTDGKPDEQTVREAVRNTGRLVSWYRNAAARRGEVPPDFGDAVAADAIARAERAERLLARLLNWFEYRDVDLGLGAYDARDNVVLDDDMRQTVEAMRERVKP